MDNKVKESRHITLQNRQEDSTKLTDFLTDCARAYAISDDVYNDLRLVVEETFINIACYAFQDNETQTVTVELNSTDDEISITFTDSGMAFNPLDHATDDIANDDHCSGGMGIHIIRSLSDRQHYDRVGQTNVFTVTKHYTKANNE